LLDHLPHPFLSVFLPQLCVFRPVHPSCPTKHSQHPRAYPIPVCAGLSLPHPVPPPTFSSPPPPQLCAHLEQRIQAGGEVCIVDVFAGEGREEGIQRVVHLEERGRHDCPSPGEHLEKMQRVGEAKGVNRRERRGGSQRDRREEREKVRWLVRRKGKGREGRREGEGGRENEGGKGDPGLTA
jgi:hypothetical protein